MPDHTSPDPRRTVDHVPTPVASSAIDATGAYHPAGGTEPHVPVPPADAPNIPGYHLTAEIAKGGMGRVYAGLDLMLNREVAIKTLLPGADAERFVTEVKITARLPHPGIPPVHALGTLADGSPYLAMKLIRGRTLAELLRERPAPLQELPRFVQIFEQIAQAVGFAHAQGVIHRDLKPLNVMVGAFGEVQVMDWGLAKDTASLESPGRASGESHGAASVTHTAAGAIMGTPGYMAPEQARGEAVDARADVFALGATLAAVLTGQPAFVATTARAMIDRAARADLADVRQRLTNSGADGELIALALRCLSAKVEERPADGRAVAAEVAAYRAGVEARLRQAETERAEALVREAEQRKRRRTVQVAGAVIAVVLLMGLSASLWQMLRANQNAQQAQDEANAKDEALKAVQQARADETTAQRQAFAALRSMTANVVERKFAQGAVLTEDDQAFLRGVIAQYDAFAAIKGDDADSRAVRAEGRLRVGEMRFRLGELKDAEKDYNQALGLYKQLVADSPARPEFRQELATSHNDRGILLAQTGQPAEAEKDFDQALSIQEQLVADSPARTEFREELATSHSNRGVLLKDTGRLPEAEKDYDQALSIRKQLATDVPARPEFRQVLAQSHLNRALLHLATGRFPAAKQDYDQALGIYKQLTAGFPKRPEFRQELAHTYNTRGNALGLMGRPSDAEEDYDQALSIRKQLAADFPTRPVFRQELAQSHGSRANLLRETDRLKEAEQEYDQAQSIFKQLVDDFPTRPEFRKELALCHNNRALALGAMRRLKEAEKDYDQALSIQKRLAADLPNQPDLQNDVAGTCVNLAFLHLRQGNGAAAKRLLLEGQPHHLAALKANPRHPAYRQFYRNHLDVLNRVHAGLLEQEDAVRNAETRRDVGWDAPADAYDAACFLSRSIIIAFRHAKLDDSQRNAAAQFYGDAAMKLLRDAVNKGYKDAAHMKNDTDLGPLRLRVDFRELVAELDETGK